MRGVGGGLRGVGGGLRGVGGGLRAIACDCVRLRAIASSPLQILTPRSKIVLKGVLYSPI